MQASKLRGIFVQHWPGLQGKVNAHFLFNKFPQKISFSQWGEFQGLLS
jgi:hypothetical protein